MDWFNIETKVRQLVSQLLEPTIKKTEESQESLKNMEYTVEYLERRVEHFESIEKRVSKKFKYIKDLKIKLANVEAHNKLE